MVSIALPTSIIALSLPSSTSMSPSTLSPYSTSSVISTSPTNHLNDAISPITHCTNLWLLLGKIAKPETGEGVADHGWEGVVKAIDSMEKFMVAATSQRWARVRCHSYGQWGKEQTWQWRRPTGADACQVGLMREFELGILTNDEEDVEIIGAGLIGDLA